ncbi:MAG: hypothetical protein GXP47_01380 [Acidobacteria bacterium]|nr:hypothetical protein [Acidobacteriota bacterium]
MNTGLLFRLLGIGRVPPVVRETLEDEGFLVLDEGIRIAVHYRNYRAPGKRFWQKKTHGRGAVAVTERRFIAFAYLHRILNVRLDDPRLARLGLALEGPEVLAVTIDPSIFCEDRSGEVVYRFHTARAQEILAILEARSRSLAGWDVPSS